MIKVANADYITSAVHEEGYPIHEKHEIVLLGRSNVGKSTFINKFTNRKKLAYTSAKPGKTQTLNFFDINEELCFVDVPGYGYARVSKKQRKQFGAMIEEYLVTRENIRFVILLVDFKVGPTKDDILMYEFLKFHEIGLLIIATKKDKIKNSMQEKQKKAIEKQMNMSDTDLLYAYSSDHNKDIEAIHDIVAGILDL